MLDHYSNEGSGSGFEWIKCPENSAAIQALGSIAQVIAALLTLVVMVCLGRKQNKMFQKQNDLAMVPIIEKRKLVHDELISAINDHKNKYPIFLFEANISDGQKNQEESICYMLKMEEIIDKIKIERNMINSYFEKKFTDQAELLIDEEIKRLIKYQEAKTNINGELSS